MITVYHHIYKNAGSTVWQRFRRNKYFYLVPKSDYPQFDGKGYAVIGDQEVWTSVIKPKHIHGRVMPGLLEKYFDDEVEYTTTLRHPVDRLVSGYYFYKKSQNREISFEDWLPISKTLDTMPMPFAWQYEWFLRHSLDTYNKFDSKQNYTKAEQRVHADWALEQVDKYWDNIFFLEHNWNESLQNQFAGYTDDNIHLANGRHNETHYENTLPMDIIEDYMEVEIEFYKKVLDMVS